MAPHFLSAYAAVGKGEEPWEDDEQGCPPAKEDFE